MSASMRSSSSTSIPTRCRAVVETSRLDALANRRRDVSGACSGESPTIREWSQRRDRSRESSDRAYFILLGRVGFHSYDFKGRPVAKEIVPSILLLASYLQGSIKIKT